MFIVSSIRQSEGGHKLSHEALEIIVFLAADELLPAREEKTAAELLMDAHDYVWGLTNHYPQHIRLEVCDFLFSLATDCTESGLDQQREIASLIEKPSKPTNKKRVN